MKNGMFRKMLSLFIILSLIVIVAPAVMSISYKTSKSYDSEYYDYDYYDYEYDTYRYYNYATYDYDYYSYNYYYLVLNYLEKIFERFPTLEIFFQRFFF